MNTAVITTGGLGTRLLTYTKTNPKTMLPIYEKSHDNISEPSLRPLIEFIFENLYDQNFRRFCFVVGKKTKDSIINHLSPDLKYIELLKKRNNADDRRFIKTLKRIYKKMDLCEISWISQSTPMGFGHALFSAKKFVGDDTFLLHTGDAYFPNYDFLTKMIQYHLKDETTSVTLLLQRMKELKEYGVAQLIKKHKKWIVVNVEEKPKKPKSKFAILPIYIFDSKIFRALRNTQNGYNNELQVTDAVKTMLSQDERVIGFNYKHKWYDIGSPKNYMHALNYSYNISTKY